MNKFLYMPVVLGLVFGCAGYAGGNNNNLHEDPLLERVLERARRVEQNYSTALHAQHTVSNQCIDLLKQCRETEEELTRLSAVYDENTIGQIEALKCCKRELATEEARDKKLGLDRFDEETKAKRMLWMANEREKINNIFASLENKGLHHILDKINEYMVINTAWRTVAFTLGDTKRRLELAEQERSIFIADLKAALEQQDRENQARD
ncbi:MAG: hypothetical protein ACK5PQ_05075 [Alphaproteobacteria bacterium]